MMKSIRKELARYPAKRVLPLTKPRLKPFDGETTFAEVTLARKEHTRKYHGPDSLLYSAIYPVVCVMKVFGLAPYDFTGDEITPSNACLIFSFVFIGIYCHIIYIVYKRFLNVRRDKAILSVVETTKVIPTVLRDLMVRVREGQFIFFHGVNVIAGNRQLPRGYARSNFHDIHEENVQPYLERPARFRREAQPIRLSTKRDKDQDRGLDTFGESDSYLDGC